MTAAPKKVRAVYHYALPLLLSQREAAHLLHTDRGGDAFKALLHKERLRLVPAGKASRIPLEDVQRVAREGFSVAGKPARAVSRPRTRPAPGVAERIRSIPVEP